MSELTERERALLEAFSGQDRSLCPYHVKSVTGIVIEGSYGPGTCAFADCASPDIAEPLCVTGGPQALTEHPDLLAEYGRLVKEHEELWR